MRIEITTKVCAWAGCRATCSWADPIPPGWVCLITFSKEPKNPAGISWLTDELIRDAVLCPLHADALEGHLKQIKPVAELGA